MPRRFSVAALRGLHTVAVAAAAGTPLRSDKGARRTDLAAQRADAATDVGLVMFWMGRLSCWSEPSPYGWQLAEARGWAGQPSKPPDRSWRSSTGPLPEGLAVLDDREPTFPLTSPETC